MFVAKLISQYGEKTGFAHFNRINKIDFFNEQYIESFKSLYDNRIQDLDKARQMLENFVFEINLDNEILFDEVNHEIIMSFFLLYILCKSPYNEGVKYYDYNQQSEIQEWTFKADDIEEEFVNLIDNYFNEVK
jgi:hypothetical protein